MEKQGLNDVVRIYGFGPHSRPEFVAIFFDGQEILTCSNPAEYHVSKRGNAWVSKYFNNFQTATRVSFEALPEAVKGVISPYLGYALTKWSEHRLKVKARVPINKVLDYMDRKGIHANYYIGCVEPGYDDKPMICSDWNPPKASRIGKFIENFYDGGIEVDWSDEWDVCCNCNKAFRISPDCYQWTPYYFDFYQTGERVCVDCAPQWFDEIIEEVANTKSRALCDWSIEHLEKAGFKCFEDEACNRYETGFHPGQNDTPEKVLAHMREVLPFEFDVVWVITDKAQFDLHWRAYFRKKPEDE